MTQGTKHCPVSRTLKWAFAASIIILLALIALEWHWGREDAIAQAESDTLRAMIERDEVVALVTFGAPKEELKLKWNGGKITWN